MKHCYGCLLLVAVWLITAGLVQAQRRPPVVNCAAPELTDAQRAALDQRARQALLTRKSAGKLATLTYVPIRPHIFRTAVGTGGFSVASLNSVLALANSHYLFNGSGIQFYLAGETPDYIDNDALYTAFTAFDESSIAGRDVTNAMNMYFVNQFDQALLGGYAYFPDNSLVSTRSFVITGSSESNEDLGNRLVPHELGHNFNLYHTFQGSTSSNPAEVELVTRGAGANCTTSGDGVCDTPADPYGRPGADVTTVNGCPVYNGTVTDPNGDPYNPSITNIMSYYFPCTHDFTPGQHDRIEAGLALRQSHTAYSLTYPAAVMSAPGNLTATFSPRGYVQLTWQDNATNEAGYFVERANAPGGPFGAVGGVAPNVVAYTDQSVAAGQTYYYRIRPSNTTIGSLSPVLAVTTGPLTCRPVYTSGCADGDGLNAFTLNNDKLSEASGCSVGGYHEITARRTALLAGQSFSFTATLQSGNTQSLTIWADLNRNGQYESAEKLFQGTGASTVSGNLIIPAGQSAGPVSLRVMANSASAGLPTDACGSFAFGETEDYGLTILTTCPVPTSLTTSDRTTGGGYLTWASGGAGLQYELLWRPVGATAWTTQSGLTTPAYALTGLLAATGYDWQVRTICSPGSTSAFSAPAAFTTAGSCAAPTRLTALAAGATRIMLNWTPPGPGVTYTVRWQPVGSTAWSIQSGLTDGTLSLTGLAPSTSYNWRVRTDCGSAGTSAEVNGPVFQTTCPPPTTPAVLTLTTNSATLSWSGSGSVEVQWRPKSTTVWITRSGITTSTYQLTGLLRGTTYEWQVRTICSASTPSDWVPGIEFTTAGCQPTFTYGCTQHDGISGFTLNGVVLSAASGCSVSGYEMFTAVTTTVRPGQTYSFRIKLLSPVYNEGVRIWADVNRNDLFEPGETLYQSLTLVTDSVAGNVTIPTGTAAGPLPIRVMAVYSNVAFESCGNQSYGEAEDYRLTVLPACTSPYSVQAGLWSSPATWSCNQVPGAADTVEIRHYITLPDQYTGAARRVIYTANGKLRAGAGARLKLGF